MSTPNDGGPAFPVVRMPLDPDTTLNRPGMTLRDWFAGQALNGIMSNQSLLLRLEKQHQLSTRTVSALYAYSMADTMLTYRKE